MNDNLYCVIMAGGTATKFWPVSRDSRPKQFLDLTGTGKTFIRMTYDRFARFIPEQNILVVTLAKYGDIVKEQIPELPEDNLILEPYGRNTAPCVAYSTYKILKRNPAATIVTTPADHFITDEDSFHDVLTRVVDHASSHEVLMTLGIPPTKPEINYGYIQVAGGKAEIQTDVPRKVKTFVEKPDRALAEVFCNSGEFYWNSGIFAWQASVIKQELEKFLPEVVALFKGWEDAIDTEAEADFMEKAYGDCPKISIDYGVMEKTEIAWICTGSFGWSDLDTWNALYRSIQNKDESDNAILTDNKLLMNDSGNLVFTTNKKKIYAVGGLKDFFVIDTEDALLICPRDSKQVKDLISGLGMPENEGFR